MIRRVLKFFQLRASDQLLLVQAFGWVAAVRVGLAVMPFRKLLRLTTSRIPSGPRPAPEVKADHVRRIVWAVLVASRRIVPDRPCLTQALAARVLLRRRDIDTSLRIGVKKEKAALVAHAWLEEGGRIIIGGERSPNLYVPFKQPIQS